MSHDLIPHSNEDQEQSPHGEERIDDVLVRHAKENLELAIWVKALLELIAALLTRDLEKLHLKLVLKLLVETLPFRKLEVWIAEDRLLQAETGIRTDKQHRPLKDLEDWGMIQRQCDERGYRYRVLVNVSDWKAPFDEERRRRLKDRSKYIRRERRQLCLEFLSNELKDKITQLHFEAFGDAMRQGLEQPDGKPIPHGGGLPLMTGPVPTSVRDGVTQSDRAAFTHGGGMTPENSATAPGIPPQRGNPCAKGPSESHSPATGDCRYQKVRQSPAAGDCRRPTHEESPTPGESRLEKMPHSPMMGEV